MIRDFTQEAKDLLHGHVDAVNPEGAWEYIKDVLGDLGLDVLEWIGALSLDAYIDDIDGYHNKIIDKNNVSREQIDKIFQDVEETDSRFAGRLGEIAECIAVQVQYVNRMAEVFSIKNPVAFSTAAYLLKGSIGDVQEKELRIILGCYREGEITKLSERQRELAVCYVESQSRKLGRDVTLLEGDEKKQEQMFVVDLYRMLEPGTAEGFDSLFGSADGEIEEFDRYNIMYIAYTSEEPFHSLFFNTLGSYTIGSVGLSGTSYFSSGDNTINFDVSSAFYHCPKGAYNTFFHECGHAIDYQMGEDGFYSVGYDGGANYGIIYNDVYSYIGEQIDAYGESNGIKNMAELKSKILASIRRGDTFLLNTEQKIKYDIIKKQIYTEFSRISGSHKYKTETGRLAGTMMLAGVSDVYGGITNNVVMGNRGHFPSSDTEPLTYWYNPESGEKTGAQEKEMWAHYFSFSICGDEEAVGEMEKYLPETMEQYGRMAEDMKEGAGGIDG